MFLNTNKSDRYTTHTTKALMKLSKLISDFKNPEISSIEENDLPPSSILLKELSKPVLDQKKLHYIRAKGVIPKGKKSKEERNMKLIMDIIKKYKGYEQFKTLHKINDKSIMIMAAIGNIERYKKGDTIYAKKDIAEKFYYIIKGHVLIKDFDQKKVVEEYENKINDYKNQNKSKIEIHSYNNAFNAYNSNIKLIDNKINNNKNINPIFQLNPINNTPSSNDNSYSNSILFNKKSKDLLQNKMHRLEQGKLLPQLKIKEKEKETHFDNKKLLDNIIISKRRKPLFFLGNNLTNDNSNDKSKEEDTNKNNNNITDKNNFGDLYMKSFSELQHVLTEKREQGLTVNNYQEGNFFGEWEIMFKKMRENTAYCIEDTDLLVIDCEDFKDYFKNEMLLADFERKFFIKRIIPILDINYMPIMIPIFYSKGDIVYTEYDVANYFYIIYKGSGALKQLKDSKNKNDIMLNLNKLETLLFVDKGCIVGLECCKGMNNKEENKDNIYYDNTFIINEENTLIYKINLAKFRINKEEMFKLKNWLKDLYKKQNKLIRKCKEKLFQPKISREILLKHFENKTKKKFYYYRDPKENINKDIISKNNDFPVKRKSININIALSFDKSRFSSLTKESNLYSKNISEYNSFSFRSSNSNRNSSSGFSRSNSKEKEKEKSNNKNSLYHNYKTITPFILNDELIQDRKSFNPINQRNTENKEFNGIRENRNSLVVSPRESLINKECYLNEKINKLRNDNTKQKYFNGIKDNSLDILRRQKYDDSFYKLIFKKHYRKVSVSSKKKDGKRRLSLFLYDSGQFDIPLISFGFKKKEIENNSS